MPVKKNVEPWVAGFRATLKTFCGRGWSVQEEKGHIRLNVRTDAIKGQCALKLRWEQSAVPLALKRVEKIQALVRAGSSVKDAGSIACGTDDEGRCNWDEAAEAFKSFKLTKGGPRGKVILSRTWENDYAKPVALAVQLLNSGAANSAYELVEQVIEPWEETSRFRHIAVNSTDLFLRHCTRFHGLDASAWALHPDEKAELKGPVAEQRRKAVMDREQMLTLLDSLGSRSEARMWRDAIKTMIVYGLRPAELNHLSWRSDPRLDKRLPYCSYQKPSGIHKTRQRFLDPSFLEGQQWDELTLDFPSLQRGRLNRYLARQPYWQKLREEFAASGKWLRPYVFRDSYSYRVHAENRPLSRICSAMGHDPTTHQHYYEWGRESAVVDAAVAAATA